MLNPNIYISIPLALLLFVVGHYFIRKQLRYLALFLCLPGLSIALSYIHLFDSWPIYIQFRSISGIENSVAFFGLLAGSFAKKRVEIPVLLFPTLLLVSLPYVKPIIRPLKITQEAGWKDQICLQTTPATCGPASLASIFKHFRIEETEKNIAQASYSCSSGTEIWYLLRYAQSKGLSYHIYKIKTIEELNVPSIIGTTLGNIGHFVCFLGFEGDELLIGDPLIGLSKLSKTDFEQKYKLSGLMVHFKQKRLE